MTIDSALEKSRSMKSCFVGWRCDTGEIVLVEDASQKKDNELNLRLEQIGKQGGFPTIACLFGPGEVTREELQKWTEQHIFAGHCDAITNDWARASAERLVDVLEREEYAQPYVGKKDARFLLLLLFQIRAEDLAARPDLIARLRSLQLGPEYGEAGSMLKQDLAVLEGDVASLKELYRNWSYGRSAGLFIEAYGDLRSADPEVVEELISVIEWRGGFSWPRIDAMVALGKIGAGAGLRAAQTIRAQIEEGSEYLPALKDLVLKRITTPPESWVKCDQCCRGRVLEIRSHYVWPIPCPRCLEMGFVAAPEV